VTEVVAKNSMVVASTDYRSLLYQAMPGYGFDGVVMVRAGNFQGTGVLLYDGRAILTAAHVLYDPLTGVVSPEKVTVRFQTKEGTFEIKAKEIKIHENYDPLNDNNDNNDLALIWLSSSPPVSVERYELYRSQDELGKIATLVGYGLPGTGFLGANENYRGEPLRLKVKNRFETEAYTLKQSLGYILAWNPQKDTQLVADFDDGSYLHDALGRLLGIYDTGLGPEEGFIAPGDSGSPAFIDGKVAGIASYVASLLKGFINPDVDSITDSSFGELAFFQRVSHYQEWIDKNLRAHYPSPPKEPYEVKKEVLEGNSGTHYVYFLVKYLGERPDSNAPVSVDYATRDGTAKAYEDYIPVKGTLVLYPCEDRAVIPVEIIGDTKPEPTEYFYLDIFNPVGGSFGPGIEKLSAVRYIIDDDGFLT